MRLLGLWTIWSGCSGVGERPLTGIEDDMRPRMAEAVRAGRAFALATITAADGGPRPMGSQMLVTEADAHGFLSGGCIEADVALHGREVLTTGIARRLVYGRGSPFIDMRLPCGGRLEVLVERIAPDDGALLALFRRRSARCARKVGVRPVHAGAGLVATRSRSRARSRARS